MREDEDRHLVTRMLRGDNRAFRAVIEKYTPLVYSVVEGILRSRRSDIEDVMQEVFVKVYVGLPSFRGKAKLSTWLYQIARNTALNAAARFEPPLQPVEEAYYLEASGASPEDDYQQKRTHEVILQLIDTLDEPYRIVLKLRYMGEFSYEEIAGIMDIPIGTVKTHLFRAKTALKTAIEMADRVDVIIDTGGHS